MQVIHNVTELDAKIAEADRAEAISDEAMRAVLASFRMDVPLDLPADPLSDAYRAAQMALYTQVTGRPYTIAEEATPFDVDRAVQSPFPFYTGSSATAGEYFMAIGYVLHVMALPPGSRVLEFGPGWGHTSLWLAQLGHRVTVVDVEEGFCALIRQRAAQAGVTIEVIQGEFFHVEQETRQFDAVLFYDCFHHCADHLRLLRALKRIVAPEGRLFFGAEPIVADFPVPWGIRLDGWALWGVRKNGWMELGFRDDYFARALSHTGWFGRKISLPGMDRLRVWEARHRDAAVLRFTAADRRLQTQTGTRKDGRIVIGPKAKGTALYGPYVDLPPGAYIARVGFQAAIQGTAVMDVVHGGGQHRLARGRTGPGALQTLQFEAAEELRGVELRLFPDRNFAGAVEWVEFVPVE